MIAQEIREVINSLITKTKANQVNWFPTNDLGLPTTGFADDYAVSLPTASLNIYEDLDEGELVFMLLDTQGNELFHVSLGLGEEDYELLEELLTVAKFKARRVEVTLEHIKDFLETKEIIGVADLPPTRLPNVKRVAGNDLGKGVEMGGRYQDPPQDLQLVSSDWARWGDGGSVKSGWFYNPPDSDLSHAVAFFKIHCHDNGNGYVQVLSASNRRHEIWLQTNTGSKQKHSFSYRARKGIKSNPEALDDLIAHWPFTWKKPNSQ